MGGATLKTVIPDLILIEHQDGIGRLLGSDDRQLLVVDADLHRHHLLLGDEPRRAPGRASRRHTDDDVTERRRRQLRGRRGHRL